jgi:hypothetical protein
MATDLLVPSDSAIDFISSKDFSDKYRQTDRLLPVSSPMSRNVIRLFFTDTLKHYLNQFNILVLY